MWFVECSCLLMMGKSRVCLLRRQVNYCHQVSHSLSTSSVFIVYLKLSVTYAHAYVTDKEGGGRSQALISYILEQHRTPRAEFCMLGWFSTGG